MRKYTWLLLTGFLAMGVISCADKNPAGSTDETEITEDQYSDVVEDFAYALTDSDEGIIALNDYSGDGLENATVNTKGGYPEVADTTFEHNGLVITLDRTFYDVEGNESEVYDPETSVRMTRYRSVTGTITRPRRTAIIDQEGLRDVVGITPEDEVRTINGEGHRDVESEFTSYLRPVTRTFVGEHNWTITDLERHIDQETNPWPLSGTIVDENHSVMTIERSNETITREVDITLTVSFDGTQYAQVVTDNGLTYWVDLETGEVYYEHP